MCVNENHIKVHIAKHMSDSILKQKDMEKGNALSSLLFKLPSECDIWKFQENEMEMMAHTRLWSMLMMLIYWVKT
jgi:hypothetical protein